MLLALSKWISLLELKFVAVHCCLLVKLSALFPLLLLICVFESFFRVCIYVLAINIVLLTYLWHRDALMVVLFQVLI